MFEYINAQFNGFNSTYYLIIIQLIYLNKTFHTN